ncbi:MAG: OmpA/MotB domain protein [Magnetococcales bacterium]|nr:OmpA/MotB domain protein [Magnetococcales bacterium]
MDGAGRFKKHIPAQVTMMPHYPPLKKNATLKLNTLTSLILLLFVFFVWLLSFAKFDMRKFEEAAGSIRGALGLPRLESLGLLSLGGGETLVSEFSQEIAIIQLVGKIGFVLTERKNSGEAEVVAVERGFIVRLSNDSLFQPSSIKLRDDIKPTLQQLGHLLAEVENEVFVSGYTDDAPPPPGLTFASNWGYSAALAAAVVQFLSENSGIAPVRLQAVGMGQYSPRQPNDTDTGRAANRRIEMFVSRVKQPPMIEKNIETQKTFPPEGGDAPVSEPAQAVP